MGVAGVFGGWTFHLRTNPEVAMHFVEYGVLGLLIFRAMAHRTRDPAIYVAAVLVGAIVGTLDEVVQWLTPRRFFDYEDIRLNAWAGMLMQVGIAMGIRPPVIARPVRIASMRRVCRFGIVLLLLIGLCLSNTPRAVAWLAARVPTLAYAAAKDRVMTEYGHRHVDPGIGVFYSRFPLEELARLDRERAVEAAGILDEFREPEDYAAFLKVHTPATDPFVHEARVHLFRRDHYWSVAWKHRENDREFHLHCTVAYRENQILEKYFGETLSRTRERLTPGEVAFLAQNLETDTIYRSGVSSELVTRFSLRQAWAAILLGVVVLAFIPRILSTKAS